MKRKLLLLLLLSGLLPSLTVLADSPPIPPSKTESLNLYETRLKKEKNEKIELESQIKDLKSDLDTTRNKMVNLAEDILHNEMDIQSLEKRIDEIKTEKNNLESSLQNDRKSISRLILALERIRRVPPQALIARPEAPLKTAQSARLLGDIIPAIQNKAAKLKSDIQKHNDLENELSVKISQANEKGQNLKREQDKLAQLNSQRQSIFKQTEKDYRAKELEIEKISHQANNVRDLVKRIEENEKRKKARELAHNALSKSPVAPRTYSGSAQMPISGIIKVRYLDQDKFGAKSQGIRIEGRAGGLVVAPMSGNIKFAGPFKGYDNMIIVDHGDGYHSLIAGLEKVDTLVGQSVSAGEPIGHLKSGTGDQKPSLYFELRYKGEAVNPARKLTDLG